MGYCTVAQLTSRGLNPAAFAGKTVPVMEAEIESQASFMDGYLAEHPYTLPILAPYPDVLVLCNARLASVSLIIADGIDPDADKMILDERDFWVKWLERVAAGKVTPPDIIDSTPGATPGSSGLPSVRVTSSASRGYSTRGTTEQRGAFQTD